jgi:hypothetical protein
MRKLVVVVLALAASFGCSESKCGVGTKETELGVCHIPGGAAGMAVVVEPVGGSSQIGHVFDDTVADSGTESGGKGGSSGHATLVAGSGGSDEEAGQIARVDSSNHAGSGAGSGDEGHGRDAAGADAGGKGGSVAGNGAGGSPNVGDVSTCGNGKLDPGELCDGKCQLSCDDGNPCTADRMLGAPSTCDVFCINTPVEEGSGCGDDALCNSDGSCLRNCQVGQPKCAGQPGVGSCIGGSSMMNCDGGNVCLATYIAAGSTCGPGLTCDAAHNCN